MYFCNQLPHLRVNRQKVLLPVDGRLQSSFSMVLVNNPTFESVIELINSKTISRNGRFLNYFVEGSYIGQVRGKHYREIKTKQRLEMNKAISNQVTGVTGHVSLSTIGGRNVYYDLCLFNQIFFSRIKTVQLNYKQKAEEYLKFLKGIYDNPDLSQYTTRIVAIDVDSWMDNVKASIRGNKLLENPVYMIYYSMHKNFEKFKELGNMDIIFYSEGSTLRLNPSLSDNRSYAQFKGELAKLSKKIAIPENDEELEATTNRSDVYAAVASNFVQHYNFTGEEDGEELESKVETRLDEMEEEDPKVKDMEGKELEDILTSKIINDEKILKDVNDIAIQNKTGKAAISNKRDELLRARQKEIRLDGMTLDDMRAAIDKRSNIETLDVSSKVKTTNPNITTIRFPNFEAAYNKHLMKHDMMNIFESLSDKSIPIYIRKVDVEDSSDELNYKETYTFHLEDANRVRHTLKFDMPKPIEDKFWYLNGNKKLPNKQLLMKPVTKTGPDEVQIVSNYNKIFIRRYGQKLSAKMEKFKKAVAGMENSASFKVKYGNNSSINTKYLTTVEYDELAKDYTYLRLSNIELYFNQEEVTKLIKDRKITIPQNELCIGFFVDSKKPLTINLDSQTMGYNSDWDIVDFVMGVESGKAPTEKLKAQFEDATSGKKFMYSRATIMAKQVPLILLLGYLEGLTTVLRKASVKHYFSDKRPRDLNLDQGMVQFANGYLIYDKYPFENSLLMNAFADIPTKGFNYEDFDEKDAYLSIFDSMYGTKIIGNAFNNFYELMIDPITKEVLEDLNYPTDFVSLILYANNLLSDNAFTRETDMSLYRVRSNEIANAYLYKSIATAYINYRLTANNNNPVKMSVPRDIVTKQILMSQTVEDYSTLNPIVEVEKSRAISPKGPSGLNLDQAYTQDKRSYDRTMMGLMAMSTSPDANVGVVRQLTLEPNILSPRGYIDVRSGDLDSLKDVNLFSPAELLSPLGATKDDSIRTAMATKQSKHIIPVFKSSPVLISNGAEQVLPYHLSNDFSIVAKGDGEVIEIDEKNGLIIVGYYDTTGLVKGKPDGKKIMESHQAIDITPRIVKNGAGGFFLSNKLISQLKPGQKFKKSDILAYDEKFFSNSDIDGVRFNIGSLQKIACMSSYATYEDSTFITKKLSEDMASEVIMQKTVTLGKNSTLDYIVKVGDKISVGDDLLRFEPSFDDSGLNAFLASVGDELKEDILNIGRTPIKSKYSGVIEDIKVYADVDLAELSPSLQKLAGAYYNRMDKRRSVIDKYDKGTSSYKLGVILNDPTGKIESKDGKLKGHEIPGGGILLEIYIRYTDTMGIGDKLAFFTALKSINGEVIKEGYEPYSEFRPNEEISSFVASGAVLARMTPSILLTMFGNKVIVELKRKLEEIYTGKPWEPK